MRVVLGQEAKSCVGTASKELCWDSKLRVVLGQQAKSGVGTAS